MRANFKHFRLLIALLLGSVIALPGTPVRADTPAASIPAGKFESVLPPAPGVKEVKVAAFLLDRTPVTNAQFAKFVAAHPQWRRDRVAAVFADSGYLSHWQSATEPGNALARQPVVHVSWFAAKAYCEARGARLPSWYEWEYAAAASETQADARKDPAWRQRILAWYSQSARGSLPDVGQGAANFYGVHDLHGVVWEWVEDLSAMLVSADNREQGDPDATRFCGSGALTMEQKENYAILMRIAMLSSMQASYTSSTMGFRCASDLTGASTP
ncbi:MAG TPA: formylglycine-generating enzyme family protein [Steroidobacteraceae bacterium]